MGSHEKCHLTSQCIFCLLGSPRLAVDKCDHKRTPVSIASTVTPLKAKMLLVEPKDQTSKTKIVNLAAKDIPYYTIVVSILFSIIHIWPPYNPNITPMSLEEVLALNLEPGGLKPCKAVTPTPPNRKPDAPGGWG